MELSALVNEGEDTAGWEVTAGLGVAGVVRQVTCEAVLQEVLGQSRGRPQHSGSYSAAQVEPRLGGDLEVMEAGNIQTVLSGRGF